MGQQIYCEAVTWPTQSIAGLHHEEEPQGRGGCEVAREPGKAPDPHLDLDASLKSAKIIHFKSEKLADSVLRPKKNGGKTAQGEPSKLIFGKT